MQDLAIICNIANIFVCHLEDDPYTASICHKACLKDNLYEYWFHLPTFYGHSHYFLRLQLRNFYQPNWRAQNALQVYAMHQHNYQQFASN